LARAAFVEILDTNIPESGLFSNLAARGCLLSDKLILDVALYLEILN